MRELTHYDLFSGIGGFSLAIDEVFKNETIKHIFCEWEQFPTAVLKKHWPDGEFWGDIAELVAHTKRQRLEGHGIDKATQGRQEPVRPTATPDSSITIVTGGFPCQPFSAAGRRRGTDDDRYLWPEMFRVIQLTKPEWVIAENVRGLVAWNEGVVLEQVCADLESAGYEVQPFVIPAVAVNAPHRRDRVWIIAYALDGGQGRKEQGVSGETSGLPQKHRSKNSAARKPERTDSNGEADESNRNANAERLEGARPRQQARGARQKNKSPDWSRDWQEVAFTTCDDSVDDGLPRIVDGVPISRAKWRKESLKAYGNAIVPQVAVEVFKAIKQAYKQQEESK